MSRPAVALACLGLLQSALVPATAAAQTRADAPQAERPAARSPGPAARPFGPSAPSRLPKTVTEPWSLGPRTSPNRSYDTAPMPNRSIEAPRDRLADRNPSLEPMLLQPDRRQGMTFGREHLRETGPDRPFDNIVPGARLRIPFE